jgi:hypothetical protein
LFQLQWKLITHPATIDLDVLGNDWGLVESSFQCCYGINLEKEIIVEDTMSYRRFIVLFNSLPSWSPLVENLANRQNNSGTNNSSNVKEVSPEEAARILGGV